jgi:hypothetical protein
LFSAIILLCLLLLGGYYFYFRFKPSNDQIEILKAKTEFKAKYLEAEREYYVNEYFATDIELSYIFSQYYIACKKKSTRIKYTTDILNIPDKSGLIIGVVKTGQEVTVLLYCPALDKYKIKFKELKGWVDASELESPNCGVSGN